MSKKNAPVKPNKTRAWYSYESGTAAGWEVVGVFGYKYLELSDIDVNIYEIRSELSLHFNEIEKNILFDKIFPFILRERDKNRYVEMEDLLKKIGEFSFDLSAKEIVGILLDYSLVVYMNSSGELFFNYRENNIEKSSNRLYVTLPKGVYHYYNKLH